MTRSSFALWAAIIVAFSVIQFQLYQIREHVKDTQYDVIGLKVLSELHAKSIDEIRTRIEP